MLKSKSKYDNLLLILSISLISLTVGFGLFIRQHDFTELLFFYGFFFVVYAVICRYVEGNRAIHILLGLGLFLRLVLVFVMPNLSDDIYRFIWDGRLIINGISPFAELPKHYIENKPNLTGIDQNLFNQLNSPDYFTVYPPVPQSIFAWASFIFPKNIWASMVVMKLVLLLFEAGTFFLLIKLLQHYSLPRKNTLLYALNPLIIWDAFANVHFEIAMVFFVLLALWFLTQFKWINSAFAMSFAVLSKLIPLMLLPFLIKKLGWKKAIIYFLIVGVMVILCFLPFFNLNTIKNLADSLDLYFQRFEYNASIYYALRYIGLKISGYNLIQVLGPVLALITAVSIFVMAFWKKKTNAVHPPAPSKGGEVLGDFPSKGGEVLGDFPSKGGEVLGNLSSERGDEYNASFAKQKISPSGGETNPISSFEGKTDSISPSGGETNPISSFEGKTDSISPSGGETNPISPFGGGWGVDYAKLPVQWLFATTIFLLLATTVHPWYLSLMIALSVLTRFRYPILWSGLIVMTYVNYSYAEFSENLWIVALEYTLLFAFISWEILRVTGYELRINQSKIENQKSSNP